MFYVFIINSFFEKILTNLYLYVLDNYAYVYIIYALTRTHVGVHS